MQRVCHVSEEKPAARYSRISRYAYKARARETKKEKERSVYWVNISKPCEEDDRWYHRSETYTFTHALFLSQDLIPLASMVFFFFWLRLNLTGLLSPYKTWLAVSVTGPILVYVCVCVRAFISKLTLRKGRGTLCCVFIPPEKEKHEQENILAVSAVSSKWTVAGAFLKLKTGKKEGKKEKEKKKNINRKKEEN